MAENTGDPSGDDTGALPGSSAVDESSLASAMAGVATRAEREAIAAEALDFRIQCRHGTEIFRALDRALKVRKLYAPTNDAYRTALDPVASRLGQYLKEHESLSVIVTSKELRLRDAEVYTSDDRDTSIAFQLYKNGIRRLTIDQDVDPQELLQFVEVMEQDRQGAGAFDDDLVTLLWKRDLLSITYRVIDPVLDEEGDLGLGGDDDDDKEKGHGRGGAPGGSGGDAARTLREEVREFIERVSTNLTDKAGGGFVGLKGDERADSAGTPIAAAERSADELPLILALQPDEAEQLKQEVLDDQRTSRFGKFVDILFALLERESDEMDLEEAGELIGQMLQNLFERGDFPGLVGFAERVRGLLDQVPPPVRERLVPQLERLASEELLAGLPAVIRRGYQGGVEALKQFLASLGEGSTEGLRRLLAELKDDREHRQVVIEVMIRGSRRDLSQIARGLYDVDIDVVLATISVLKGIRDRTTLRYLPSALKHRDPKVRIAALDAMRTHSDAKATGALLQGLDDQEGQVRVFALQALRGVKDPRVSNRVSQVIEHKGFGDRPAWEQQHYFELLIANRGPRAFDILKDKLTRKGLFSGRRFEPTRCAAAKALARLPLPATLELLRTVRDKEKGDVAEACAEALRNLAKHVGGKR